VTDRIELQLPGWMQNRSPREAKWFGFALLSVFFGVALAFPESDSKTVKRVVLQLILSISAGGWILLDARARGRAIHPLYVGGIGVVPYLALPTWLFHSRGFFGGVKSLIKAAAQFVACITVIVLIYQFLGIKIAG
jgi:hypothetical protein